MARPTTYKHSIDYYFNSYIEYSEYFAKGIGKRGRKVALRRNQRKLSLREYIERVDELKGTGIKTSLAKSIYTSQGSFTFKQADAIATAVNNKLMPKIKAKVLASKAIALALRKQGLSEEDILAQIVDENEIEIAKYYNKMAKPSDIRYGTPFGRAIIKYLEEEYSKSWHDFFY